MKKIFITDIDGTLIHHDERDKENIAAFKRLKENNNIVVACTGRSLEGVEIVEKEHEIKFDYYIVLNGAMILDSEKNIVNRRELKNKEVYDIINSIKSECLNISINNGEKYYLVHGNGENLVKEDDGFKLDFLELEEILNQNILAIAIHYKKEDGKHIEPIGDSGNDISMLSGKENSFTFDYVEDEIKQHAKHIIGSFSECIDNYVLKK